MEQRKGGIGLVDIELDIFFIYYISQGRPALEEGSTDASDGRTKYNNPTLGSSSQTLLFPLFLLVRNKIIKEM